MISGNCRRITILKRPSDFYLSAFCGKDWKAVLLKKTFFGFKVFKIILRFLGYYILRHEGTWIVDH